MQSLHIPRYKYVIQNIHYTDGNDDIDSGANNSYPEVANRVLRGVEDALTSMFDITLLLTAQPRIGNDTYPVPASLFFQRLSDL